MLPGPIIIRECPHCKGHFKERTLASGNTFGARYWTDGKMDAEMLPESDWLVMCPNCLEPVWLDKAAEVEEIKRPGKGSALDYKDFHLLEFGRTPSAEGALATLRDISLTKDEKTYVRFKLWWRWNNARRYQLKKMPLKGYEIANLEALLKLLDGADINELVTKAEIYRELGQFNEAIQLLDWPDKSADGSRIEFIRQLACDKDPYVREFIDQID